MCVYTKHVSWGFTDVKPEVSLRVGFWKTSLIRIVERHYPLYDDENKSSKLKVEYSSSLCFLKKMQNMAFHVDFS